MKLLNKLIQSINEEYSKEKYDKYNFKTLPLDSKNINISSVFEEIDGFLR